MDIYEYKEGMDLKKQVDGAYWERNMLVMFIANILNYYSNENSNNGWYYDTDNNWEGWKRVISLCNGRYCFHIPDDLEILGDIPEIKPNWDGHTTKNKWLNMINQLDNKDLL